jgi:hypothetical protein
VCERERETERETDQISYPYKTIGKIVVLILMFYERRRGIQEALKRMVASVPRI